MSNADILYQKKCIDEKLVNYEEEKRKEQKLPNCYKSETNMNKHLMFLINTVLPYVMFTAIMRKYHKNAYDIFYMLNDIVK